MGLVIAFITLVDLVLLGLVAALPHALNPAQLVHSQEHPSEEKGVSTQMFYKIFTVIIHYSKELYIFLNWLPWFQNNTVVYTAHSHTFLLCCLHIMY